MRLYIYGATIFKRLGNIVLEIFSFLCTDTSWYETVLGESTLNSLCIVAGILAGISLLTVPYFYGRGKWKNASSKKRTAIVISWVLAVGIGTALGLFVTFFLMIATC